MDIFSHLNSKQEEAVRHTHGPILILAGPGSGKTRTLIYRLAYLIDGGVLPSAILAVTFTNKAANEMRERTEKLVGRKVPWIGTFHSICARILRSEITRLGYTPYFSIYDEEDQAQLIRELMHEQNISPKEYSPRKIANIIANAKEQDQKLNTATGAPNERVAAKLYEPYNNAMRERNALDFADLLVQTIALFREHPNVLAQYQKQFSHILVDEYQDTNHAQYILVKMLSKRHGNICVVGDDSQSIYSWRGADFRNILRFEEDWPNAHVTILDQNYRSTQIILDAASALIKHNTQKKEKTLWTERGQGEKIVLQEAEDGRDEARIICETIQGLVTKKVTSREQCAVLYRTNAQSRALEEVFMAAGMPYTIVGGVAFYARREVKDILAYLRLLMNPRDKGALVRIINTPPRGIGKVSIANLRKGVYTGAIEDFLNTLEELRSSPPVAPARLIEDILKYIDYEKYIRDGTEEGETRWDNVGELVTAAERFEDTQEFLEHVALVQSADTRTGRGRVVLMTMHAAKGLEFDRVFIAGCEEDLFPHTRSVSSKEDLEEERRLCYVALTRARTRVYCTFARRRVLWGTVRSNPPSRFLFEIPEHLIEFTPLSENYEEEIIEWN